MLKRGDVLRPMKHDSGDLRDACGLEPEDTDAAFHMIIDTLSASDLKSEAIEATEKVITDMHPRVVAFLLKFFYDDGLTASVERDTVKAIVQTVLGFAAAKRGAVRKTETMND